MTGYEEKKGSLEDLEVGDRVLDWTKEGIRFVKPDGRTVIVVSHRKVGGR